MVVFISLCIAIGGACAGIAINLILIGRHIEKIEQGRRETYRLRRDLDRAETKLNHLDKKLAVFTKDINGGTH